MNKKKDVMRAFKINSVQNDDIEPLDWEYNVNPHLWNINGEIVEFDWIKDNYIQFQFLSCSKLVHHHIYFPGSRKMEKQVVKSTNAF